MRHLFLLFAMLAVVACSNEDVETGPLFNSEEMPVPAGLDSAEPNLAVGADNTVLLSWLEPEGEAYALRFARLGIKGWSAPLTVAKSADWFINWADFPSVVPVANDLWAAHWLHKTPGSVYSYDVAVAISTDHGQTWTEGVTPHTDGTYTEHGFVTLFPQQDGVGAVWLDGRQTASQSHGEHSGHDAGGTENGMTLRAAVLNRASGLSSEQEIDALVCDCCQTDVATTTAGPIVVYRDRSEDEIRDIYASRFRDGRWLPGVPVATDNWQIAGCPVNGPAIAARNNAVAVAWFTAADGRSKTKVAFSADGGTSFGEPVTVDTEKVLGRTGIALLPNGDAAVSWMKNVSSGRAEIRLQRISPKGSRGSINVVAETSAARISGFPQLVATQDSLVLAWTDVTDGTKRVRSARINFADID